MFMVFILLGKDKRKNIFNMKYFIFIRGCAIFFMWIKFLKIFFKLEEEICIEVNKI